MLKRLTQKLSPQLEELGFEALDELDGVIGANRHGVWDWTWIRRRRIAPSCYASLYGWSNGGNLLTLEAWARLERDEQRSLVRHFDDVAFELDQEVQSELIRAMLEAARRSAYLAEAIVPSFFEEEPEDQLTGRWRDVEIAASVADAVHRLERTPYQAVYSAARELFTEFPDQNWRNQDVLVALLERGFPTDRADVNAALSELASTEEIERVSRGVYRSRNR